MLNKHVVYTQKTDQSATKEVHEFSPNNTKSYVSTEENFDQSTTMKVHEFLPNNTNSYVSNFTLNTSAGPPVTITDETVHIKTAICS